MSGAYLTNWLYVAAFVASGGLLVVLILLTSKLVNPDNPTKTKLSPYECGIEPVGDSWHPFAVRYYVFALLFLVFDVESIYLFPWTITFRSLGGSGFIEMMTFIAILVVGLVYAWRKGALAWV